MINHLKQAMPTQSITADRDSVADTVRAIIADIRERGDTAVRDYSEKFDHWSPDSFRLTSEQINGYIATCPAQVIADITTVQANVRRFAQAQRESLTDFEIETSPGVFLG